MSFFPHSFPHFPRCVPNKVSKVVSNLQATHICRICLEETRGEMKRRQTIQVCLVRDLTFSCLVIQLSSKKKGSPGRVKWAAQFCCKFVRSSTKLVVCTCQERKNTRIRMCFGCSFYDRLGNDTIVLEMTLGIELLCWYL